MNLLFALFLLLILYFPFYYKKLYSLELGPDGSEVIARWLHFFIILVSVCLVFLKYNNVVFYPEIIEYIFYIITTFSYVELILRVVFKYVFPKLTFDYRLKKYQEKLLTISDFTNLKTEYIPHPFLQFTNKRDINNITGNYDIGLGGINSSDLIVKESVVRIICMGDSVVEEGNAEQLELILKSKNDKYKFQVFNFGKGWWNSNHNVINLLLNVIDLKPDFIFYHQTYNDIRLRGFKNQRSDGAHAVLPLSYRYKFEWVSRYSICYRILLLLIYYKFNKLYRKYSKTDFELNELLYISPDNFNYSTDDLKYLKRNFEIFNAVSKYYNIKLILGTISYSEQHKHNKGDAFKKQHMKEINNIMKSFSVENNIRLIDYESLLSNKNYLYYDPIHLTREGLRIKAEMLSNVILNDLL